MAKPGKQFEDTIAAFLRQLDPAADIRFDIKVPDRDSGAPRQADGWARLHWLGHPVDILISCKDHARPLDVGEIEAFISEIHSARATTGIIYSRSGFSPNAIIKGRAHKISCCRYFDNQPPECPSEILLAVHAAYPTFFLTVEPLDSDLPPDLRWSRLLGHQTTFKGQTCLYREAICRLMLDTTLNSSTRWDPAPQWLGPPDLLATVEFPPAACAPAFRLKAVLVWDWFAGHVDAIRLRGALNMTTGQFAGSADLAPIPMLHTPNSSTWSRCAPPASGEGLTVSIWLMATPTERQVVRALKDHPVFGGAPLAFGAPPAAEVEMEILNRLMSTNMVGKDVRVRMHFGSGNPG